MIFKTQENGAGVTGTVLLTTFCTEVVRRTVPVTPLDPS